MLNPYTGMIEYVEPGFRLIEGETINEIIEQINAINGSMIEPAPSGRILSIGDNGTTYTNEGASSQAVFVLPEATRGLKYGFIIENSHGSQIITRSGQIAYLGELATSAGGTIVSDNIGAYIQLIAINASMWIAIAITSNWTTT